jgi:hypothetical protein
MNVAPTFSGDSIMFTVSGPKNSMWTSMATITINVCILLPIPLK